MIRKNIKERIKEYFFLNPTAKLRVRQIEKKLKLPLPSVIRYCREFEKEGILTTIRIGNIVFYTADRASSKFLLEKKLFNIKRVYDSGLVDYLRTEFHNPAVVVFGSSSKGEDVEDSDIDLYIETASNKNLNLSKFEKYLERKIQIFVHKNIREVSNPGLANNIINGIALNGFVEVFK